MGETGRIRQLRSRIDLNTLSESFSYLGLFDEWDTEGKLVLHSFILLPHLFTRMYVVRIYVCMYLYTHVYNHLAQVTVDAFPSCERLHWPRSPKLKFGQTSSHRILSRERTSVEIDTNNGTHLSVKILDDWRRDVFVVTYKLYSAIPNPVDEQWTVCVILGVLITLLALII